MPSLEFAINGALAFTLFGLVAGCIRMLKGPTAADRIVSLDFITILLVAITSLLALSLDNAAYLDLGLALALVGFLATVAFARYLETNDQPPLDLEVLNSGIASTDDDNDAQPVNTERP